MRFVVLMAEEDHFARWERAGEAERRAAYDAFGAFAEAVAERGEVVAGAGLAAAGEARTLRPAAAPGGERPLTEGPYAETVEQVGGLWLVDLPDLDTALELARLLPAHWAIEVRPTVEG